MRIVVEIFKWLYGLFLGCLVFLFLCLLLDVFCYWIGGGWNPLLGEWPIFSGTLVATVYSDGFTVGCLLLGFSAICRLVMWNWVPEILGFLMKHPE